ncbi:hypothetical protein PIB30_093831 [Stylosanthes scabra]|uniref:Uncharacterized protein n=1 Tax=Stylosanthes scabra TaxID=79078 RepID=A0ABU6ZUM0_9FABA|nr:hypothetical protein [Stylosanthes scabra]
MDVVNAKAEADLHPAGSAGLMGNSAEISSSTLSRTVASCLRWSFWSGNGTHTRNSGSRKVKNAHGQRRSRGSLILTQEYIEIWRRWGKTSKLLMEDLTHVSLLTSNLLQSPARAK